MSVIDEKGKVEDINTYTAVSDDEFKQNENASALSSFNDFDITSEDEERVGDINSITGIGNSSKENTQNKIGKFGVGFKAVFQYTDTPEIYDDAFKFKIEDLIVPTLIDHYYPDREPGETLFVLPFRSPQKSFNEIRSRLESLKNPILFLRHLKRIIWRIESKANKDCAFKVYSKSLISMVTNLVRKILLHLKKHGEIHLITIHIMYVLLLIVMDVLLQMV
jgi:hypothetical protein